MYSSLKARGFIHILFVLDRCNDNSECVLKEIGAEYIKTPWWWMGRKTSSARNYGLKHIPNNYDVLFLDGDRYIEYGTFENIYKGDNDVLLFTLNEDSRDLSIPYSKYEGRVNNNFYSCGVFFRRKAINKILKFQKGQLFCKKLEKDWGCEDLYLGDVCYHLCLKTNYYLDVKLHGKFEKTTFDTLDIIKKRFKLRDKLNVKW